MEEAGTVTFNSAQYGGRSDRLSVARGRPHTLHQFFATHLLNTGYDIRMVHELLSLKERGNQHDPHLCSTPGGNGVRNKAECVMRKPTEHGLGSRITAPTP